MKAYFLPLAVILAGSVLAQNSAPQISIQNVLADTVNKTITINYSATDSENDPLEISAYLSADSGYAHVAHVLSVSGDVGYPVTPGQNLSLTLDYTTDSLLAASGQNGQAWIGVKVVASDRKPVSIADMIANIDSASVYADMQFIARPRYHTVQPATLEALKDSLETRFARYDLQTERLGFNYSSFASENVKGRKPGSGLEKEVIIVDGHFDAVPNTPGADDNASAIAGVLAAARVLSNYHFKRSFNFLGFDKEEQGLFGSSHYVNNSIKGFENIEGVLNMEMIGYYSADSNSQQLPFGFSQLFPAVVDSINNSGNKGIFLFVVGNSTSSALTAAFDSVARTYVPGVRSLQLVVPGNGQLVQDLRRSDHAVFWDAGYPALMLTDGANFRNPNYHTPGDSLATLNIPFLVRNIRAVVAAAAALAEPISATSDQAIVGQLLSHLTVGMDEQLWKTGIQLFPNPSSGEVYVLVNEQLENAHVAVYDATGRLLIDEQAILEDGVPYPLHIDQPGTYTLNINHGTQHMRRKFIVTRRHEH
jgi:hypothetical protein